MISVDLLPDSLTSGQLNRPIRVCKIGDRRIGVPSSPVLGEIPVADAVVVGPGKTETTLVRLFHAEEDSENRLLMAGCDPAMPVLARHLLKHGDIEVTSPQGAPALKH